MNIPKPTQSQVVADLLRENVELRRRIKRLEDDKTELQKFLIITLQDNLNGQPAVVSRERFAEARGEFILEENPDGGLLIRVRRAG